MDDFDSSGKINIGGYCMSWSCMFIHYHLLNISLTHEEIYSLLVSRFSSVQLSKRINMYYKNILSFFHTKKIPSYRMKNLLSRKDLEKTITECQKFIRTLKIKDIKYIDSITGAMLFGDIDTNESFYNLCGLREFIFNRLYSERGLDTKKINILKNGISTIAIISSLDNYSSFIEQLK